MKLALIVRCALQSLLALCLFLAPKATLAKTDSLRKELDTIADKFHGKIGYSLHHLKTGDRLERLGDEQFPTASTIKLAILCAAMEKEQKGEIGYDDARPLTEQDRQYGTGLLHNYRAGTKIPLRDLLNLMITRSDNTAAIMLGQWIGIVVGLSCSFGRKVRAGGRTIDASTLPRAATAPVARNAWSMPVAPTAPSPLPAPAVELPLIVQ